MKRRYFFFGLTFCVSVEAATDLAALLAFGSFRIFDADEATRTPVTSLLLRCVKAEAATDFSALLADLLCRIFDAAEDTFLLVLSDLAMEVISLLPRAAVSAA